LFAFGNDPSQNIFSASTPPFFFRFFHLGAGFTNTVKSDACHGRRSVRGNSPFATATHNVPKNSHRCRRQPRNIRLYSAQVCGHGSTPVAPHIS